MPLAWSSEPGGWIRGARRVESPNRDERPDGAAVDLLVVHYISLPPGRFAGDAIERLFTNTLDHGAHPFFETLRGLRVSSHFLIRRRGELLQFVATGRRAWHAGVSSFQGRERCNDYSVGVELEGTGDVAFTGAQYRRLAELTRVLAQRLPLRWLAGHSDVAPGRKDDPGPRFDWRRYESAIAGSGLVRPY
jgi:N-acetyl-anhydromuramoyl-L-alanine amidase